jgi:Holliday junction resolvase
MIILYYSFSKFGRDAEFLVGLCLKSSGWNVYFSKGSRGPSDVVAIKNDAIWLIQIKSSAKIPKIHGYEIRNLIKMSNKINNSFPVLSLVSPKLDCNPNEDSIICGDYMLNFYLLPDWKSVTI